MDIKKIISYLRQLFLTGAAIYISDDFVDVAKGSQTAGGLKVSFIQRYPLLKTVRKTPYEDAKDDIDKIIDKAFSEDEEKPYRVAVNIRNDSFILRHFIIKGIPENKLGEALVFEAQKYVPYHIDNLIYGFKVCSKKPGLEDIIFCAAEKENVNNIIRYFEDQKMLASIVEPAPMLLATCLSLDKAVEKEGAYLSIHYEPTNKAIITGIHHKMPHFVRELRIFPGDEEFKTAELSYPQLKDVWPVIKNDIVGSMEYLAKEARKDVDKIFISGFSYSPEEKSISAEFGIPFERMNLTFAKGIEIASADRFAPTLALLNDSFKAPHINLAPKEAIHKDPRALLPVAFKSALIFFAIIAVHLCFLPYLSSQSGKLAETKNKFAAYKSIDPNSSRNDVLQYMDKIQKKAVYINDILTKRIKLAKKLSRIGKDLIKNSWVEDIDYQNGISENSTLSLKISGSIYTGTAAETSKSSANSIVELIKKDPVMMEGMNKVEVVSVEKTKFLKKNTTRFEILLR